MHNAPYESISYENKKMGIEENATFWQRKKTASSAPTGAKAR
jgi:hypothetical protein